MTQEEQVKKAIQYYFDGTANGDIETLKKGYTEDCKIYFIDDSGQLAFYDQSQFHDIIKQAFANGMKRDNELISIEITKHMARAKTRSDYPDFYFDDYLTLLKVGEDWKIVGKATVKTNK